jgi:hypothetical protein
MAVKTCINHMIMNVICSDDSNGQQQIWVHVRLLNLAFWKWPTWLVESTRCAAFPKKVWTPVAITTASISPCLTVEPEYTPSPGPLVTGNDSPVNADYKYETGQKCEMKKPSRIKYSVKVTKWQRL